MDERSVIFLDSINVPFIKIGSGDVNNLRLIKLGKLTVVNKMNLSNY
jgi:sialic acid synthase SpsE